MVLFTKVVLRLLILILQTINIISSDTFVILIKSIKRKHSRSLFNLPNDNEDEKDEKTLIKILPWIQYIFFLMIGEMYYGGVERPNKNISSFGRIDKSFERISLSLEQIKHSFGRISKSFEQIKDSFRRISQSFEQINKIRSFTADAFYMSIHKYLFSYM